LIINQPQNTANTDSRLIKITGISVSAPTRNRNPINIYGPNSWAPSRCATKPPPQITAVISSRKFALREKIALIRRIIPNSKQRFIVYFSYLLERLKIPEKKHERY